MMQSPQYEIRDVDIDDIEVRVLSDDVAVLAYKVHEELTVDGEPVKPISKRMSYPDAE